MSLLYLDEIHTEQTTADKNKIKLIYHFNAVHYVISGQGYYNGRLLKAGDGFFCFKNNFAEYAPDPNDPWKYVWLRMNGDANAIQNLSFDPDTYCFKFNADEFFFNAVDMISSNAKELLENPKLSDACLRLLFSRHINSSKTKATPETAQTHAESARKYILLNFHKNITPDKIASKLNISRAHLRNVFYEAYSISPRDFIIKVRIDRAKELLHFADVPIKEIAHSVGYDDVLQFFKIFKKYVGMSPSDYRKQYKQTV